MHMECNSILEGDAMHCNVWMQCDTRWCARWCIADFSANTSDVARGPGCDTQVLSCTNLRWCRWADDDADEMSRCRWAEDADADEQMRWAGADEQMKWVDEQMSRRAEEQKSRRADADADEQKIQMSTGWFCRQICELHILGAAAELRLRPSKDILQDLMLLFQMHQSFWFKIKMCKKSSPAKKTGHKQGRVTL